ncbi:MAG: 50S ribosomal protein L33 [Patescibacteria group bacterium]|nr:50S ribosomal protein L33 [Patescibacteria group bacterium]
MAAKRKPYVRMRCEECKNINYYLHKSKMLKLKEEEQKLGLKKFCSTCRKHLAHVELKK